MGSTGSTMTTPDDGAANIAASDRKLSLTVCLDGSERAAAALAPAHQLAQLQQEEITVVVLANPDGDTRSRDTGNRVEQQLALAGLDDIAVRTVESKDMLIADLIAAARSGATPVLSAFGQWNGSGRLYGVLGDLVRADIARVVAIGPRVSEPLATGPIVVSIDTVGPAGPLREATRQFLNPTTPKILVAHVVSPTEVGISYAVNREGAKFRTEFALPVDVVATSHQHVGSGIAHLAQQESASLIVARSWHRSLLNRPTTASTSLSIVAEAPCPVVIVN